MRSFRTAALIASIPALTLAQGTKELPLKYSGPPTKAEISAGDLMTRLYIYADDSMLGRAVATPNNTRATNYIESEVRRLKLVPAGDNGTYFQSLPIITRALDTSSTVTVSGTTFHAGTDFIASTGGRKVRQLTGMQSIYGGTRFDSTSTLTVDAVRGKILVLRPFVIPTPFDQRAFVQSAAYKNSLALETAAGAIVTVTGDQLAPAQLRFATTAAAIFASEEEAVTRFTATTKFAEGLLGAPLATVAPGATGNTVTADIRFVDTPHSEWGRNVVAILPGSDPRFKGEYVAIGAHNDHISPRAQPVDHDSLKIFNAILRPQGADGRARQPTPVEAATIKSMLDSVRKIRPARLDSINNGADDDGSGTVSVLEIAEQFALGRVKPKRSIIFVWHAGEEAGLWGSQWFTDHPTIPRESIVAQLNMDMVGRGAATDVTGATKDGQLIHGGPGYLQIVGSRRNSTELGDLIETVNKETKLNFNFDYSMDANGHPQNIYCRSDHYEYARYGIPIAFMTTGGHADYHMVTDEPQYIDYSHMADIARLIFASAVKIANLDHRVVVDKPKPDPKGACVQ